MKSGSDNFRESSIQGIMQRLAKQNIEMLVYEPSTEQNSFFGVPVTRQLKKLNYC